MSFTLDGRYQPDAVAFCRALGCQETGRETQPNWSWTLVYFVEQLLSRATRSTLATGRAR